MEKCFHIYFISLSYHSDSKLVIAFRILKFLYFKIKEIFDWLGEFLYL